MVFKVNFDHYEKFCVPSPTKDPRVDWYTHIEGF